MEFPEWVNATPDDVVQTRKNQLEYGLRLAALRHNSSGSIPAMVEGLCTYQAIIWSINRGYFSRPLAFALENLCGKSILNKEFLMSAASGDADGE